ncbi:hypothetical protein [Rhodoplanes azumiensis]|uniref:DUF4175 domain-containing protein n=1 Tax=Rhodoplanes azumiensis TaxID=1897628 RepID=A0ABW5AKG2_9BRAD
MTAPLRRPVAACRPAGRRDSLARLWAWPIAVAVASTAGLIAALVGDGLLDVVSWLGLGLPVAVSAWFWVRRPKVARRQGRARP